MTLSIFFFVVLVFMILGAMKGYSNGTLKELQHLAALICLLALVLGILTALSGYWQHNTLNMIMGILLVTASVIIYKLFDFLTGFLEPLVELPLVSMLDNIFGLFFGVFEVTLLCWMFYLGVMLFNVSWLEAYMSRCIGQNIILAYMFDNPIYVFMYKNVLPVLKPFSDLSGLGAIISAALDGKK